MSEITEKETKNIMSLKVGEWGEATTANSTAHVVIWSSSDPSVASVNPITGSVYATGAGRAVITATAKDCCGDSESCKCDCCEVEVTEKVPIAAIRIDTQIGTLSTREGARLEVSISPKEAECNKLVWCSSDSSVVYVYPNGTIRAVGVGSATITVASEDDENIWDSITVSVVETATKAQESEPTNKIDKSYVADPVDAYSGAHTLKNTVFGLFGGQKLSFIASYSSTKLVKGELGIGWHHNFEKRVEECPCEILVYESPESYVRYLPKDGSATEYYCATLSKQGYTLTVNSMSATPYCVNCGYDRFEHYDADGKLVKIVDRQGFETVLTYSDNLVTITDCMTGKSIYLEKSGDKIVRVYDGSSREAVLTYSGDKLTSIKDANGNSLSYGYDGAGRVTSGTDSNSVVYFRDTYDGYGRVVSQLDAICTTPTLFEYSSDGTRTTTNRKNDESVRIYDSNGLLTSYTDENGITKTYEYDARCNLTKETDGKGNSVIKVFNELGKPTSITDKNGNTTTITYDEAGNVTKITYPSESGVTVEETFTYNDRNQLLTHTDLRGTVTTYTYSTSGLMLTKKVGARTAEQYAYEGGLLTTHLDALGRVTRYAYDAMCRMIRKTDAAGHVTTYEYDNCGNVTKVTDALGKSVITTYDGNGQKTSVTDANGNITRYEYNGNLKLTKVIHPDNTFTRYEYDAEDRQTKVIDAANNVTETVYDAGGRVTSKKYADGAVESFEYDAVGQVTKHVNTLGGVTLSVYDAAGNVTSVTDDDGKITTYVYDKMSRVSAKNDAVTGVTTFSYSTAGDLVREQNVAGNSRTYTYDAYGQRLTAKDERDNVTTYTYDMKGNMLTAKDALNNVTSYAYNALGQLVSVTDAKAHTVRYGYDAVGRRTTITDARNNTFTTFYDANGNVIKTTDAKGNTVSEKVYNSFNLPTSVTDAAGRVTTYTYNALHKVATVTDPLNNVQEYSYNSRGMNIAVKDALDNTSTAEFDSMGNITRLAGPLGGATNYVYDKMGRMTSKSTTSGGTVTYTYNAKTLVDELTNARGGKKEFTYDYLGRISGYTSPEGTVSYAYDAASNVITVTDSHGTITRSYDALNRVTSYTDTYGKVIRYEYDAVGNLAKVIYPDNSAVSYTYDENNNLVTVTDWANRVTSYTYDVNNRVVGVVKPDGSITTTVYDNAQRVTSTVERTSTGTVITGFEYTYDELSRIVEEKVLANSTKMCYTYDDLSRVTSRTIKNLDDDSVVSTETFTYDAAGNVTGSSADTSLVYDTDNKLTSYNGNTVTYDLDGNMLSNGTLTCTYDSANRLITAGGHTYTYNAEDVRIRNLCDGHDTKYTYDTNRKLSRLLLKDTNGVVTKYVYGKGLIGEEKVNVFKTYHFDSRGSTVAITDINGNITDTFKYDTYGKLISRTGTSFVIFGYNGRDGVVTDKNGLIYMRARYYSPEMKRFVNADIVAGEISNAVTLNRYAYANGNPVSFVDPFGLCSVERGGENDIYKTWEELGFVYDGSMRDFRRLENGLPPYAYEVWLNSQLEQNIDFNDYYHYNRDSAIAYANKWAGGQNYTNSITDYLFSRRNPQYYSYSSNCANFVSQCIYNAGVPMNEEWKMTKTPKESLSSLPDFLRKYKYEWAVTEPWRLAQNQYEYFSDPSNPYINGEVIIISSVEDISTQLNANNIQKGDLLYWSNGSDNEIYHATMISKVENGMLYYTGNSSTRFDQPLSESLNESVVYIVRMNDYIAK